MTCVMSLATGWPAMSFRGPARMCTSSKSTGIEEREKCRLHHSVNFDGSA
jgi:hypothetical protein